jgi:UDP-glucose 4-epimerase
VIPIFITALLEGRSPTIYGDGHQSRDFTYVANVVHGNLLASQASGVAGRILNLANGRTTSLLTLLEHLQQMLDVDIQPLHEPPRPGDVRDSMADITLARQLLGYETQVGFEEGLAKSIDYYQYGMKKAQVTRSVSEGGGK